VSDLIKVIEEHLCEVEFWAFINLKPHTMCSSSILVPFIASAALMLTLPSCDDEQLDANDIGGDTDIELTEVGSTTSMNIRFGSTEWPSAEITVLSRNEGRVTYGVLMDFNGHPDEDFIRGILPVDVFDTEGRLNTTFDMKFTSEGVVDYFWLNQPWIVGKYGDGVGTEYVLEGSDGLQRKRVVTEKTGLDDFPYGFLEIKTSKIEQEILPEENELVEKVEYRLNHRFGLVNVKIFMNSGETVEARLFPWHVI
jgi:hypothetical protein